MSPIFLPVLIKNFKVCMRPRFMSSNVPKFETLNVKVDSPHVYSVELNRPEKYNAMNRVMWKEVGACFQFLEEESDCRSIILSGSGRLFSAGLDMSDMGDLISVIQSEMDIARKSKAVKAIITEFQNSFSMPEKCTKPVIAAIHGACVGGAVDLICSADIRYCTQDAWFQVKEVDLGLAADIGTLQRLPLLVGSESLARELVFTARKMFSDEAKMSGLVSRVFSDQASLQAGVAELASRIASKSPVAVQGSKQSLIYSRDNGVEAGLQRLADWNMTMLQSEDLLKAAGAMMSKSSEPPKFESF